MDALMAALVAALLAHAADRPAWLAAILADRWRPGVVLAAAAAALAVASSAAVTGGVLLAPLLTPEIRRLLLAAALVLQGGGALFPLRAPDRLAGWRIGAAATAGIGFVVLFAGDGVQLVVLALAAQSPLPWLAVAGATAGGVAALAPAAIIGEADWRRLPVAAARRTVAAGFVLAGLWIGASAAGLA